MYALGRDMAELWSERLKWLLDVELAAGFGFRSGEIRQADHTLDYLAGYKGWGAVNNLASSVVWDENMQ